MSDWASTFEAGTLAWVVCLDCSLDISERSLWNSAVSTDARSRAWRLPRRVGRPGFFVILSPLLVRVMVGVASVVVHAGVVCGMSPMFKGINTDGRCAADGATTVCKLDMADGTNEAVSLVLHACSTDLSSITPDPMDSLLGARGYSAERDKEAASTGA